MQGNYLLKTLYLILKNPPTKDVAKKAIPSKHLPAQGQQERKV